MKKIYLLIICSIIAISSFFSCEPYEEFISDFDFPIVYFGTQKPLRTIVAYDDMSFKVGVTLGGKRTNQINEIVNFEIDPSLLMNTDLVGANGFQLLPQEYYSLSDEVMIIKSGTFIGDVNVSLNRDAFTMDPLATQNHYALPLRITASTTDSVAVGSFDDLGNSIIAPKDYTIVVVKYISPLHGTYYKQGTQWELNDDDEIIEEQVYNNPDIIRSPTWDLETLGRFSVDTNGIGTFSNAGFILELDPESNVVQISTESLGIIGLTGEGVYDSSKRVFELEYNFTRQGKKYRVVEKLTARQAPELDLRFEEW